MALFADRRDAGRRLGRLLADRHLPDPVVLALPRGGVPVALEVARALGAPLDLVLVRKLGVPGWPEVAAGAVVDGVAPGRVVNADVVARAGLTEADLDRLAGEALREIARRRAAWLGDRAPVPVAGRSAVVVDDGLATGATARAALAAVRRRGPARLVLAVPVAPRDALAALAAEADEVVCAEVPARFVAVGSHYDDFRQLGDEDVARDLAEAAAQPAPMGPGAG